MEGDALDKEAPVGPGSVGEVGGHPLFWRSPMLEDVAGVDGDRASRASA